MPIINPNDTAPVKPKPNPQAIAKPQYMGVTVDTKLENVSHLLTHVEGSSWTANYYSQVLNMDSPTQGQGLGTNPVHQQYKLIRGMELKVSSALSVSQDDETKNMIYTGEALVYPFIIPNEGDMFLADVGAGREGVFEVTDVQRLSIQKQAVHRINYRMVDYVNAERLNDLTSKVVQTFQYDKEFLTFGQNPLLFEDDYADVQYMRRNYKAILTRYFKTFFSVENSTLLVPAQDNMTYDHFLVKTLLNHFSTWDAQEIQYIRPMNMQDDYSMRATQVWDVLSRRDKNLMRDAFLQVGKVWTREFEHEPMLEGIRYTQIVEVVYPVDAQLTVDYKYTPPQKLVNGNEFQKAPVKLTASSLLAPPAVRMREVVSQWLNGYTLPDANGQPVLDPTAMPPVIHPVMKDGYYVFSKGFYENDRTFGKQSMLELMVHDYLDDKALSVRRLRLLCEDHEEWNALDRFYYVPVLLLLMKSAVRGL